MFGKFRYRLGYESRAVGKPVAGGAAGTGGGRAVGRALTGRLRRALGELAVTTQRTAAVVTQARARLAGQVPDGATRLVSLHDPDARPA